tara:strand:+ start:106 stop:279 length:174 start_codon:yes stop_codon:yes gene_type:complete
MRNELDNGLLTVVELEILEGRDLLLMIFFLVRCERKILKGDCQQVFIALGINTSERS